jgi:disulfide bond formation protein DsbB
MTNDDRRYLSSGRSGRFSINVNRVLGLAALLLVLLACITGITAATHVASVGRPADTCTDAFVPAGMTYTGEAPDGTWKWTISPLGYRCIYYGNAASPIRSYSVFHSIESPSLVAAPLLVVGALGLAIVALVRHVRRRRLANSSPE